MVLWQAFPVFTFLLWLFDFSCPINGIVCICNDDSASIIPCVREKCELTEKSPELDNGSVPACLSFQHSHGTMQGCGSVSKHGDTCSVNALKFPNGAVVTRCWCTGENFCNIDILKRAVLPNPAHIIRVGEKGKRPTQFVTDSKSVKDHYSFNGSTPTPPSGELYSVATRNATTSVPNTSTGIIIPLTTVSKIPVHRSGSNGTTLSLSEALLIINSASAVSENYTTDFVSNLKTVTSAGKPNVTKASPKFIGQKNKKLISSAQSLSLSWAIIVSLFVVLLY